MLGNRRSSGRRQARSRAAEVGGARADRLVKHPTLDRNSTPATAKNRLGEAVDGERSVRPGLRMGSRTAGWDTGGGGWGKGRRPRRALLMVANVSSW